GLRTPPARCHGRRSHPVQSGRLGRSVLGDRHADVAGATGALPLRARVVGPLPRRSADRTARMASPDTSRRHDRTPLMTFIDISLPIGPDLLTWPGNPEATVTPFQRIADGDSSNVSELRIGTHSGTHVDPPVHFVEAGAGIDHVPLDVLAGE